MLDDELHNIDSSQSLLSLSSDQLYCSDVLKHFINLATNKIVSVLTQLQAAVMNPAC